MDSREILRATEALQDDGSTPVGRIHEQPKYTRFPLDQLQVEWC